MHMAWRSLSYSRLHDSEAGDDGDVVGDGNDPSYSEDTVAYTRRVGHMHTALQCSGGSGKRSSGYWYRLKCFIAKVHCIPIQILILWMTAFSR